MRLRCRCFVSVQPLRGDAPQHPVLEDPEAFPTSPFLALQHHAPKMLACSLFNFKWGGF